jgi:hypothetical protein
MEDMETIKTPESVTQAEKQKLIVDPTTPIIVGPSGDPIVTARPDSNTSSDQWRKIGEQISAFLSELPEYLGQFFSEYQRPLITVGLIVGSFVALKVTLAILDAINDIPLLAPVFELVGIGYTAWFVYRYLLRASNRAELVDEFNGLKRQLFGGRDSLNS